MTFLYNKGEYRQQRVDIMYTIIRAVTTICILGLYPVQALSECFKYEDAVNRLRDRYSEYEVGQGVTTTGGLLELYAKEDMSTWTVIVVTPHGLACSVSAGSDWMTHDLKKVFSKSPASNADRHY